MKKIFVFAALLAAVFFAVSCGGSENDNNSGGSEQVCSYGSYRCEGTSSYFCGYSNNELMWMYYESCSNGCDAATGQCGGGSDSPAADNSYNANYGFISLNFVFNSIGNADDSGFDSDNYEYGWEQGNAFATGTYGNGSAAIAPSNAYTFIKQANYYASENVIYISQNPVFSSDGNYVGGNPVLFMQIDANQAAVGKMEVSPFSDNSNAHARLWVAEENWNTHQLKCVYAFAEGQINISKLGDLVYHGGLEFTGALQLYSPKNYKGQDISGKVKSQLGFETCPVVH